MSTLNVPFTRMPHAIGLPAPAYETEGAAGVDLIAALPDTEPLMIAPKGWAAIPTGLVFEIPRGYQGEVRPALRPRAPSCRDRAERAGDDRFRLPRRSAGAVDQFRAGAVHGDPRHAVAQLVFTPALRASLYSVETLGATLRGEGGFGSTGLHSKIAGE